MRNYRLLRHPDVAEDLLNTALLIAEVAGPKVALRKISEIEATIQKLRQVPHIGSIRDDIVPGLRAIPAAGRAVICFVVDDAREEVRILAIGYADSNWATRIKDRGARFKTP